MATDKNKYFKEKYIKNRKEAKETYEKRKKYLKSSELRPENIAGGTIEQLMRLLKSGALKGSATGSSEKDNTKSKKNISSIGSGNAIIETAKSKLGAPYVWGAQGPNSFDCSGLVYWVYKENGYTFGRTNAQGYHNSFDKVTKPEMGDLITFDYTNGPSGGNAVKHVALFIDSKTMIHTANNKDKLEIAKIDPYWRKYITGYRRVPKRYWPKNKKDSSSSSILKTYAETEEPEVISSIGDEGFPHESWMDESTLYSSSSLSYPYVPLIFSGGSIDHGNISRSYFLNQRVGWARETKYAGFKKINKKLFVHRPDENNFEGNMYSPDAISMFERLLRATNKKYFEVVNGFRFSKEGQVSPHEAGCAMDIRVKSIKEARHIADCAWSLGFRSIAAGGDFASKEGFLHIDIAPKGELFFYGDIPPYEGPGKWL